MSRRKGVKVKMPWRRGDCYKLPRPCPMIRCEHHMIHGGPLSAEALSEMDDDAIVEWIVSQSPYSSCVLDIVDMNVWLEGNQIALLCRVSPQAIHQTQGDSYYFGKKAIKRKTYHGLNKIRTSWRRYYLADFVPGSTA